MFYCDPCGQKNKWPESFMRSRGRCEICEEIKECNDVWSGALPIPPDDEG